MNTGRWAWISRGCAALAIAAATSVGTADAQGRARPGDEARGRPQQWTSAGAESPASNRDWRKQDESRPQKSRGATSRSIRLVSEESAAGPAVAMPERAPALEVADELIPQRAEVETLFGEPVVMQREAERDLDDEGKLPKIASDPKELRTIGDILPYRDYEPDPEFAKNEPMRNQCPRNGAGEEECPEEVSFSTGLYAGRMFQESLYTWEASNLAYNPLYFEDVQLERYGHTYPECIQPFVSVGRFSTQLLFLPYQATIDPPCKCIYPLGYYRPGECAPKLCYQPPLNLDAALVQAGVVTGMFFIFP